MKISLLAAILLVGTWFARVPVTSPAIPQQNQDSAAPSPASPENQQLGLNGPVPAEAVFKNIEILKGKPAGQVMPAMQAISGSLGVPCLYCHTQYEWEKNDKAPKQTARKMFQMIKFINTTYFPGENKVSCWTCHRGSPKQGSLPQDAPHKAEKFIHVAPADADKPAEQVFHNIQILKGVPAGRLPFVMDFFSNSLGVECSHCHVPDQWEKEDKETKQRARKMLDMVHDIIHTFYGNQGQISCYGCHEGKVKPELVPAAAPAQKGQ